LCLAASYRSLRTVKLLVLYKKANVKHKSRYGMTPLHYAIESLNNPIRDKAVSREIFMFLATQTDASLFDIDNNKNSVWSSVPDDIKNELVAILPVRNTKNNLSGTIYTLLEKARNGEIQFHNPAREELGIVDENQSPIGKSLHSVIYKGTYDNKTVAVKIVKLDRQNIGHIRREVALMTLLIHPNLLTCTAANITDSDDRQFGFIIMDYCPTKLQQLFGDGATWSSKDSISEIKKRIPMSLDNKWTLLRRLKLGHEIASGMEYLSSCSVLHRDLKPENIYLDSQDNVKITEYGFAKMQPKLNLNTTFRSELLTFEFYKAPELALTDFTKQYGSEVDVYSFGIILWQLVTKEEPYLEQKRKGEIVSLHKIYDNDNLRPYINSDAWVTDAKTSSKNQNLDRTMKKLEQIIRRCWVYNPQLEFSGRPSFFKILGDLGDITNAL